MSYFEKTDESIRILYKAHDYLRDGKALLLQNLGLPHSGDAPHDVADLERCINLMNALPFVRIEAMQGVSDRWSAVVGRWDDLVFTYGRYLHQREQRHASHIMRILSGEAHVSAFEF